MLKGRPPPSPIGQGRRTSNAASASTGLYLRPPIILSLARPPARSTQSHLPNGGRNRRRRRKRLALLMGYIRSSELQHHRDCSSIQGSAKRQGLGCVNALPGRDQPKGPLTGRLGSFGRNLSALLAAAQAFRFLFRLISTSWLCLAVA